MKQKNQENSDSSEPHFFIALIIKGTEKQHTNLFKYINGRNGAKVIYQCKSLTYLRIARDNKVTFSPTVPDLTIDQAPLEVVAQ